MQKAKNKAKPSSFRETYAQKNRIRAINECSLFCIIWGFAAAVIGAYQAICTQGVAYILYMLLSVSGLVLIVVGIVAPLKMQKGIGFIKKAASAVGNTILKVLLLPAYAAMSLINICRHKTYAKKFGFVNWEQRHNADTAFRDYGNFDPSAHKSSVLHTVIDVLSFFISNKMYIVIPVIILLLIIGAVMFFASSSAVFSFVYTLF